MKLVLPFIDQIKDEQLREAFRIFIDFTNKQALLKGDFQFFVANFAGTGVVQFRHNLGFIPKDLVQTSVLGGTISWDYSSFTKDTISATISAPLTVRFFLGRYEES